MEGHGVTCDAYGCGTASWLESAVDLTPEYIRIRLAIQGWLAARASSSWTSARGITER